MTKILMTTILNLNTLQHIIPNCMISLINDIKKKYTYIIYFFDDIAKCKLYYKKLYNYKIKNNLNDNKLFFILFKSNHTNWKNILHKLIKTKHLIYYRFDYKTLPDNNCIEYNCNMLLFINKYTQPIILNYNHENLNICKNKLYKLAVEKIFNY
jgi:hypothetical protein